MNGSTGQANYRSSEPLSQDSRLILRQWYAGMKRKRSNRQASNTGDFSCCILNKCYSSGWGTLPFTPAGLERLLPLMKSHAAQDRTPLLALGCAVFMFKQVVAISTRHFNLPRHFDGWLKFRKIASLVLQCFDRDCAAHTYQDAVAPGTDAIDMGNLA